MCDHTIMILHSTKKTIDGHWSTQKGKNIKCGDLLHVVGDCKGNYTICLADEEHFANAQAIEDLIAPNIYWDQRTGKIFNA